MGARYGPCTLIDGLSGITSFRATFNRGGLAEASEADDIAKMLVRKMPVVGPDSLSVTVIPVGSAWEATVTAAPVRLALEPQCIT